MKTIVCYGDSNTHGFNPDDWGRYPKMFRWPGILQEMLGPDYDVVEEGCNGRTTVFVQPDEPWKEGLHYLKPCINSHKPVDILIIMLGTNDLKFMYNASAEDIAKGAERLVQEVITFTKSKEILTPNIILVSPPELGGEIASSFFGNEFDDASVAKSKEFSKYYKAVADRNGCAFLDAAKIIEPDYKDQLHLSPAQHSQLAEALCQCVRGLEK
ncbi:MAG: SGNH/GDSL hydrolase family protein [Eubacterium sp.]|nr:SGNH/GDSL hydrolase family protein [Candidatus Colimonas fimequi]